MNHPNILGYTLEEGTKELSKYNIKYEVKISSFVSDTIDECKRIIRIKQRNDILELIVCSFKSPQ